MKKLLLTQGVNVSNDSKREANIQKERDNTGDNVGKSKKKWVTKGVIQVPPFFKTSNDY